MEEMFEQFIQDFEILEQRHREAAKSENLKSLGSTEPEDAHTHGENAELHEELANFYKKIKKYPTKFMRLMEEF